MEGYNLLWYMYIQIVHVHTCTMNINQIFIENYVLKTSQIYLNYKYKLKFTIET